MSGLKSWTSNDLSETEEPESIELINLIDSYDVELVRVSSDQNL